MGFLLRENSMICRDCDQGSEHRPEGIEFSLSENRIDRFDAIYEFLACVAGHNASMVHRELRLWVPHGILMVQKCIPMVGRYVD